jgi:hypothetical protein
LLLLLFLSVGWLEGEDLKTLITCRLGMVSRRGGVTERWWGFTNACRNSRDSDVGTKIRSYPLPDNDGPSFFCSVCITALPGRESAFIMKENTLSGLALFGCAPACVFGPPAYAYVMWLRLLQKQ